MSLMTYSSIEDPTNTLIQLQLGSSQEQTLVKICEEDLNEAKVTHAVYIVAVMLYVSHTMVMYLQASRIKKSMERLNKSWNDRKIWIIPTAKGP
jgi:uncharacterized ion transporter superfamily protein YfcC